MDEIFASNDDSDDGASDSTEDGSSGIVLTVEAVFQWSPCPWIKLAYRLLVNAFARSNHFICHRVVKWQCFRRFTVRKYLQLDNKTNELKRAEVKAFLRIQGNLCAKESYMQCKWARLSFNLLRWKFIRSNPFMCVQIPSADSRWSCRRLRSVLTYLNSRAGETLVSRADVKVFWAIQTGAFIHNVHPHKCYRVIRNKDEDWEDVWNDDAEVAGPTPAGFFPCRISGNGSASGSL